MRTDYELLSLTAIAAGLEIERTHDIVAIAYLAHDADWPRTMFSPLHDDGDSRRLQVRLEIEVYHAEGEVYAGWVRQPGGRIAYCIEPHGDDACRATRRAVARAAACMAGGAE